MWRFRRWRSYFLYLTVIFALAAAGLATIRYVVIGIWLGLVVLSRVGPRFIGWWEWRKHGRL